VKVRLRREGGRALVSVEDDGRGFDPTAAPASGHFGLTTMRERMQIVGGEFSVESAPGQGTRVVVSLPAEVAGVVEESAGGKQ
jgi:signal transduction histidine kinase